MNDKQPDLLKHEALDRTYIAIMFLESNLSNHYYIKNNKKLSEMIDKAQELLSEVYQEIGNK